MKTCKAYVCEEAGKFKRCCTGSIVKSTSVTTTNWKRVTCRECLNYK